MVPRNIIKRGTIILYQYQYNSSTSTNQVGSNSEHLLVHLLQKKCDPMYRNGSFGDNFIQKALNMVP